MPPAHMNSCRAAGRAAHLAIMAVAEAEGTTDEQRKRALLRLSALIDGCLLEIESRRPAPPPGDESGFEPVYL